MRNKKIKIIIIILTLAAVAVFIQQKIKRFKPDKEITKEIKPVIGTIQNLISTTGSVLPKNRLEVKPPVNGRIDEVLVKEGEMVKTAQVLAWMSSTERA
ncbi:MAG: biotin/lipoyl-binding protein, partial [Candidatus Omnitrophica bacterium]|nr:biotin/lipoyl-binding protein [Candidatus Omnitrophota bacterium]